jgi:hypothetical protein
MLRHHSAIACSADCRFTPTTDNEAPAYNPGSAISGFDGDEDDAGRHRAIPRLRDGRHLGVVFDDLWANNKSGTALRKIVAIAPVPRLGCGESLIQLKISNMGSRRRRERLTLLHDVCDQNP